MTNDKFSIKIKHLCKLQSETEWIEFKKDNSNPDKIGANISGISNSAALWRKPSGYIIWGIKDKDHEITGTDFFPKKKKIGNEELENWLSHHLNPRINIKIQEGRVDEKRIVLFEIQPALNKPVSFKKIKYIRIGSYTKKLFDYPEKERSLWKIFERISFEEGIAKKEVDSNEVLSLIDYPSYFSMMKENLPDNRSAILQRLLSEKIILKVFDDIYNITNVGAVLFAKDLNRFDRLARKALRIIIYQGDNRINTLKEQSFTNGYAFGFDKAIRYINDKLPQNEEIGEAFRTEVRMYPEIAIRELVANALIHQDFSIMGTGPTIEIFSDRIEIINPGNPLIDTLRFIDEPPRSRNEQLASMMRRMKICEERGSGIDKVIFYVEVFQLPAPKFKAYSNSTKATLYARRKFSQMNREERIRACYQHACLKYVTGKHMTNTSLRKRLGIKDTNYPTASLILKYTKESKLIKSMGKNIRSKRDIRYLPFWA